MDLLYMWEQQAKLCWNITWTQSDNIPIFKWLLISSLLCTQNHFSERTLDCWGPLPLPIATWQRDLIVTYTTATQEYWDLFQIAMFLKWWSTLNWKWRKYISLMRSTVCLSSASGPETSNIFHWVLKMGLSSSTIQLSVTWILALYQRIQFTSSNLRRWGKLECTGYWGICCWKPGTLSNPGKNCRNSSFSKGVSFLPGNESWKIRKL